jgi:hypothetical protein
MHTMEAPIYVGVDSNAHIHIMHHEHNMGGSIISTCMGFLGKTKDNMDA